MRSDLFRVAMREIGASGYILVLPLSDYFPGRMTCAATIAVNENKIPIGGITELLKYTKESEKYLFYFWDGKHYPELVREGSV